MTQIGNKNVRAIGQIAESFGDLASVFLRVTNNKASSYFTIGGGVSIEAGNFSSLANGEYNAVFDIVDSSFIGSGYLRIDEPVNALSTSYPIISYPLLTENPDKFNVHLRIKNSKGISQNFIFDLLIDGLVVNSYSFVISSSSWEWVSFEIVLPDKKAHDMSLRIKSGSFLFNCIHIGDEIPESISFSCPYVTVHAKSYVVNDNYIPVEEIKTYSYLTTLEDISSEGWYNFSTTPLPGRTSVSSNGFFAFAILTSGSSSTHYIIWDFAKETSDPYGNKCSLLYNDEWDIDCDNSYAIRIYDYRNSINSADCHIDTPPAVIKNLDYHDFSNESGMPIFINTKVGVTEDRERVELALSDKIVSIVVDQSGSMSWNDSQGLRHEMTSRMIDKMQSSYPGNVKFNVVSFGGTPIRINFFGVVESDSIDTGNISQVASSYFADQESGYAGVRVVRKQGSFPATPLDGENVTEGFFDRTFDDFLEENSKYYYKVFSFNSDAKFSSGIPISVTPRVREIPQGIPVFSGNFLLGTGIAKDSDTESIWHFDEKTGNTAYDFCTNSLHLNLISDSVFSTPEVWLNSNDVPSGYSGVKIPDAAFYWTADDLANVSFASDEFTFMGWVCPLSSDSSDRTIFAKETISNSDLRIGYNNRKLFVKLPSASIYYSDDILVTGEWHHVAITINKLTKDVRVYVNGKLIDSFSHTGTFSNTANKINIGYSVFTSSGPAFAKITEFSIHSAIRSISYIQKYSNLPEKSSDKIDDNGDRLLLLNYTVPNNNYSGGKVRILEKQAVGQANYITKTTTDGSLSLVFDGFGDAIYHEDDGSIELDTDVSIGSFTISLSKDFVHGRTYYYKIYSQNALGNFSLFSDSSEIAISVPSLNSEKRNKNIGVPSQPLPTVVGVIAIPGNRKCYIKWSNQDLNEKVKQIRVFYSSTGLPVITDNGLSDNAKEVFNGDASFTSFVHRNIDNNKIAYYSIVTSDMYGYISEVTNFTCVPAADANEIQIPLPEVRKLGYEIVNENAISLRWVQPVSFQKNIQCWLDDRVVFYAQITDDFGSPIEDISNLDITVTESSADSASLAEDPFGESINFNTEPPDPNSLFQISVDKLGGGVIRGLLRASSDLNSLSYIKSLFVTLKVTSKIADKENSGENVFELSSLPIRVEMKNPWDVSLVNYSNDSVKHLCKKDVPLNDPGFLQTAGLGFDPDKEKIFDGCYIRRKSPIILRALLKYRDVALSNNNAVLVAVHEASDPQCDQKDADTGAIKTFVPTFSPQKSKDVLPPETSLFSVNDFVENDTGQQEEITFVDIPLKAPRTPRGVMVFIKSNYNGFTARRKLYLAFENILRVELTVNEPNADCLDVSEQFAAIYLIDPDNPSVRTKIPDLTTVKWEIKKSQTGKDRPFYSTDTIPSGPGVFSLARNGSARKVFFGPACGVTWQVVNFGQRGSFTLPEIYAVRSSVVYDQMQAFEERPLVVFPLSASSFFGSRFLMELPDYINELWADGYDYKQLTISHDANTSTTKYSGCFRNCAEQFGGQVFALDASQVIDVTTGGDYEIRWGDNLEVVFDSSIDEYIFDKGQFATAAANIGLSQNSGYTNVYFSINKFIGPPKANVGSSSSGDGSDQKQTNACECLEIPQSYKEKDDDNIVFGKTKIIVSGKERFLGGGGGLAKGIPPTIIRLKEPLSIRFAQIRRDGQPVEKILVNGVSNHSLIFEVSFKDKPVPDGTPVFISVGGRNPEAFIPASSTVYTRQINDEFINPSGDKKSFTEVILAPFSSHSSFRGKITAECRYDKRGDIERSMTSCVVISFDALQTDNNNIGNPEFKEGSINNVFSAALLKYDSVSDEWTRLTDLPRARGGNSINFFADEYGEYLFAIGGLNGDSIVADNTRYSISSDSWDTVRPMNIPRFFHMTAVVDGFIYVFGGNKIVNGSLVVSRDVERYDPSTDSWQTMTSMPSIGEFDVDSYGICLGRAVIQDNKIYIIGGVRAVRDKGLIASLNDRVLIYDTLNDSWDYSDKYTDIELIQYQRISPFVFIDDDKIRISGGAYILEDPSLNNEQKIDIITDACYIDTNDFAIFEDDSSYSIPQEPRYKGGNALINNKQYFIGGSSNDSPVSKASEAYNISSAPFSFSDISDIPMALSGFGLASDETRNIYIGGGISSGRPEGFLQIKVTPNKGAARLDGRESVGLKIELLDDVGSSPTRDVRVQLRGYLIFKKASSGTGSVSGVGSDTSQQNSSVSRENLIYPVIFSDNDFVVSNGSGSSILSARSEDLLRKVDDIKKKLGIISQTEDEDFHANKVSIKEGERRFPYSIRVHVSVLDDFYYGQTVIDFNDNEDVLSDSDLPEQGDATTGNFLPSGPPRTRNEDGTQNPQVDAALANSNMNQTEFVATLKSVLSALKYKTDTFMDLMTVFMPTARNNLGSLSEVNSISSFEEWLVLFIEENPFAETPEEIGSQAGCVSINGTSIIGSEDGDPSGDGSSNNVEDSPNPSNITRISQTLRDETDNSLFDLFPNQISQIQSPTIDYYSDIEWIPQVVSYISSNEGTYAEALDSINKIKNSIPFGGSPYFDALLDVSELLLDESLDGFSKMIYSHTDNEENLSLTTLQEAIEGIQSIDGFGKVPVIINNFSVVFPTTLSSLVSRTDTLSLETIADQTGGQSQTVLSKTFVDEILNNSISRLRGAIGWGLYEITIDIGVVAVISSINLDFTLYNNTDANWKLSTSEDGLLFSDFSSQFESTKSISFENLQCRYLRFRVEIISGLTASIDEAYDAVPSPGIPSLDSINIVYNDPTESFLYLNTEALPSSAQQIVACVNAHKPAISSIEIGCSTNDSHEWIDFVKPSQPAVRQYGKIFIPIRLSQDDASLNEPLESIDGYAWKTKYGTWDINSGVVIKNSDGDIIDSNLYKVYPRSGIVVFAEKQTDQLFIDIENSGKLRVGIKITNKIASESVRIYGIGYLYNVNEFLPPPLSERPPFVTEFRINQSNLGVYDKVSVSYLFHDLNLDKEDSSETIIRWFKNGVEVEYLRNLKEWNDVNNASDPVWTYGFSFGPSDVPSGETVESFARSRNESLIRVGDVLYATIKPSDGKTLGNEVRTPSITVSASPITVKDISIKGRRSSGALQDSVTSATTAVADYSYLSDDASLGNSIIRWYVNGVLFKEGAIGKTTGGIPNDEIQVGEIINNIVAILIGNDLQVEIVPASGNTIGDSITSPTKTVENDPPIVTSVVIVPSNPSSVSNLSLSYIFTDNEITQGGTPQTDQSSISWFKTSIGSSSFTEIISVRNKRSISSSLTLSGEKWKAIVTPFDGISVGEAIESNIVTIR